MVSKEALWMSKAEIKTVTASSFQADDGFYAIIENGPHGSELSWTVEKLLGAVVEL